MRRCVIWILAVCAGLCLLVACDDDDDDADCTVGSEGCPCTSGGACDGALTCTSDLCVSMDGGAGADGDADGDADADADGDGDSDSDADSDGDAEGEAVCEVAATQACFCPNRSESEQVCTAKGVWENCRCPRDGP